MTENALTNQGSAMDCHTVFMALVKRTVVSKVYRNKKGILTRDLNCIWIYVKKVKV